MCWTCEKAFRDKTLDSSNNLKGKILSDGKKISGRGRLTDKVINTMQNYYGMAICQNSNDLFAMRKVLLQR